MTLKQIVQDINRMLEDEHHWTKEELNLIFKHCNEELKLGFYKQAMVRHAAEVIMKQLKKHKQLLSTPPPRKRR